jgi:thiol:disulfide interchange protein DsbD
MNTARRITILLTLLCVASAARAQDRTSLRADLNVSALQPGQQAVLAVVVDVADGFHAQSRTPLDSAFIPFDVTVAPAAGLTIFDPIYPKGYVEEYPALGKLDIYSGRVIVYVPIQVKPDASVGQLKLTGTATFQICDDRQCFAPESPVFEISTQVVAAGTPVSPNAPALFAGFDPAVFASLLSGKAPAGNAPVTSIELFGRRIDLGRDAYGIAFPFALLVGVLFNVMPCVLPIVPLKAMGFYQAAQQHRGRSLALGAVFSLGIIATFGALALLVVVFRVFAWGELFGNAWFAGAIVIILLLMALGTFGFFSVALPTGVYRFTPSHETYVGNFLFGILTAILSTPCTFGMFLGLLVWAAAQPAALGTALVMTVGLGMAVPYFILAAVPELARRFPRTGPWAEIIKQMMGFLLLATAIYFGRRFLPDSLHDSGFWWMLFAVVAASGVFLIIRTLQFTRRTGPIVAAVAVALLIVAPSLAVTLRLTYVPINWQKYSPEALAAARATGKPVLVKFTADWCGNCQAIEATVYVDDRTVATVRDTGVVMLKADLTRRDAIGWPLLKDLFPVGAIPFTAVYLPGEAKPHTLAGIYSTQDLLEVLGQNGPGSTARLE